MSPRDLLLCTCIHIAIACSLDRTRALTIHAPLDCTRASTALAPLRPRLWMALRAMPHPQVNCCLIRHFSILWAFVSFCKNGESANSHLHKIENHAVGASAADDGRSKSSGCSGNYRYVVFSTWTCTFCKLVFLFQEC